MNKNNIRFLLFLTIDYLSVAQQKSKAGYKNNFFWGGGEGGKGRRGKQKFARIYFSLTQISRSLKVRSLRHFPKFT